jgi:hypothetical protein
MRKSVLDRFNEKIEIDQNTGCWVWIAGKDGGGYGAFKMGHKMEIAHRVAYELYIGSIPEGKNIDHLCRNRSCVNPDHLEPVSQKENVRRGNLGWNSTTCKRGHKISSNTYYIYDKQRNRWRRECLSCIRERERRNWHAKKKNSSHGL